MGISQASPEVICVGILIALLQSRRIPSTLTGLSSFRKHLRTRRCRGLVFKKPCRKGDRHRINPFKISGQVPDW